MTLLFLRLGLMEWLCVAEKVVAITCPAKYAFFGFSAALLDAALCYATVFESCDAKCGSAFS